MRRQKGVCLSENEVYKGCDTATKKKKRSNLRARMSHPPKATIFPCAQINYRRRFLKTKKKKKEKSFSFVHLPI